MLVLFFVAQRPAQYIYTGYNQSVYTLVWSMNLTSQIEAGSNGDQLEWRTKKKCSYLYSVADGKLLQHKVHLLGGSGTSGLIANADCKSVNFYNTLMEDCEQSKAVEVGLEYGLTEFSVFNRNEREIYFMIGKFDGSIELYKKSLVAEEESVVKMCTLYNHQKLVTCIKWSRHHSNEACLIASGSNDFNVIIVDFNSLIGEMETKGQNDLKFFSKLKHKLLGHKERITNLCWSTYEQCNLLASCSYDSTVQVSAEIVFDERIQFKIRYKFFV